MLLLVAMQALRFGTTLLAIVALAFRFAPVGCAMATDPEPPRAAHR